MLTLFRVFSTLIKNSFPFRFQKKVIRIIMRPPLATNFLIELVNNRHKIIEMTRQDFRRKYLGSYLGLLWAFIHPFTTIVIYWFVFSVGFRSGEVDNVPFIVWFICGIVPWFFISDAIANATNVIIEYSFLLKKMAFNIGMLPLIKILSSLVIQIFFIIIMLLITIYYGIKPSIYSLQIVYYLFASIVITVGISWITSSAVVFMKDIGQAVNIFLQLFFWCTPIVWSFKILPQKYELVLLVNPFYYIVEGYRDSIIYHTWFWQRPGSMLYFWCVAVLLLFLGAFLFKRLRPHFADVI